MEKSTTTTLEKRVDALENQVSELMERILAPPSYKDWRSTLGMFTNSPLMREIDKEGQGIRQAEKEEARSDHS